MILLRRLLAILAIAVTTASTAGGGAFAHAEAHAAPTHMHAEAGAVECPDASCETQDAADHALDCAAAVGHCASLILRDAPALPAAVEKRSSSRWPSADTHLSGTAPEAETPPPRS